MNAAAIARTCHEVNRAYCQALGDHSQPAWEQAPEWQKSSALLGVKLHTENDVGPEASHASWMAQKVAEGWMYGEVKDPVTKIHPCIVPFDQLPPLQQAKDFIFRAVVHCLRSTAPFVQPVGITRDVPYSVIAQELYEKFARAAEDSSDRLYPEWAALTIEQQQGWLTRARCS